LVKYLNLSTIRSFSKDCEAFSDTNTFQSPGSPHKIVLEVCQRVADTQGYGPPMELVWDTASGAALHSLRAAVAGALYMDPAHIAMAKHLRHRHEWLPLEKQTQVRLLVGLGWVGLGWVGLDWVGLVEPVGRSFTWFC